jgi:UDP-glucuronate decarboxylase
MATKDSVTGPLNIGNPTEFSILELAIQVIEMIGSSSRIVHRPLPEDDPRQRQPDISRAWELLSWAPHTPLKEGLVRTIAYFEGLLTEKGTKERLAREMTA